LANTGFQTAYNYIGIYILNTPLDDMHR